MDLGEFSFHFILLLYAVFFYVIFVSLPYFMIVYEKTKFYNHIIDGCSQHA